MSEQATSTDRCIVVAGAKHAGAPGSEPTTSSASARDLPMAVVEAKPEFKAPGDARQQAKEEL